MQTSYFKSFYGKIFTDTGPYHYPHFLHRWNQTLLQRIFENDNESYQKYWFESWFHDELYNLVKKLNSFLELIFARLSAMFFSAALLWDHNKQTQKTTQVLERSHSSSIPHIVSVWNVKAQFIMQLKLLTLVLVAQSLLAPWYCCRQSDARTYVKYI